MMNDELREAAIACLRRVLESPRPSAEEVAQAQAAIQTLYVIREL